MTPTRTPDGKVEVFHVETGERFVRYPVDARAMLQTGAYTTEPPVAMSASVDAPAVGSSDVASLAPSAGVLPMGEGIVSRDTALVAKGTSPTGAPLVLSSEATSAEPMREPQRQQGRRR